MEETLARWSSLEMTDLENDDGQDPEIGDYGLRRGCHKLVSTETLLDHLPEVPASAPSPSP